MKELVSSEHYFWNAYLKVTYKLVLKINNHKTQWMTLTLIDLHDVENVIGVI